MRRSAISYCTSCGHLDQKQVGSFNFRTSADIVSISFCEMERLQCLVEEEELSLAAGIAAKAFAESPFYRYIFPDPPGRIAALTWMFLRNYRIRTGRGHGTFKGAYSADGKLLCCFWLFAEDVPGISLWDMLRHGLLEMPLRFGMASMRRMLAVAKWTDQALDGLKHEHPKHVLLERMAVLPDYQGSGVGTAALTAALNEADSSGRAVPGPSFRVFVSEFNFPEQRRHVI